MSSIQQKNKIFGIIDANNFYVSCEQAFNPKIKNKPVIVLSNNDGCVISRSKEAKALGIKMGQPFFEIKDLVEKHNVIAFSSNFSLYADLSYRFHEILSLYFPKVEIYSVDESFIDLSEFNNYDLHSYLKMIKENIYQWIKIPTCIGVGRTKTLAKLANEYAKKNQEYNGIFIALTKEKELEILTKNKIEDVWGIGKKTVNFLKKNNIYTPYDLIQQNQYWIRKNLTINGLKILYELKGLSCKEIESNVIQRKKSATISRSFRKVITEKEELESKLLEFCVKLSEKLILHNLVPEYLGLYLRSNPFDKNEVYYSNHSMIKLPYPSNSIETLKKNSFELLKKIYKKNIKFKKMGLYALGLRENYLGIQKNLFEQYSKRSNELSKLIISLFNYYNRLGKRKILFGKNLMYGYLFSDNPSTIIRSGKYTLAIEEVMEVYIK